MIVSADQQSLYLLVIVYKGAAAEKHPPDDAASALRESALNNKLTWPLNMVTEMYSLPAYDGVDPNPLMAPFFILFYGIMMADMGYGL